MISTYNCVIIAYLGDTHSDDESDPANIFEPVEESATCDGKNTMHINHFHSSFIYRKRTYFCNLYLRLSNTLTRINWFL
jgi:hypothetical protein